MLFAGLHERFEVPRIKAQSPPDLYKRNPTLPNPAVERGNRNGQIPGGFSNRQKSRLGHGPLLAIEFGFLDQMLALFFAKRVSSLEARFAAANPGCVHS